MSDEEQIAAVLECMEPFLSSRLPDLGLDYETYGPYLLPLIVNSDEEEWESILELLRASSETHSDDEEVWQLLRRDVEAKWKEQESALQQQLQAQREQEQQEYQQDLEREREAARQAEITRGEEPKKKAPSTENDAAKRALVARFEYENDEAEEGEEEHIVTNHDTAAQVAKEHAHDLKNQNVTTKKEEQQTTARDRLDKAKAKEDRKKRAVKGERKR
jgi:hypothetical protein